MVKKDHLYKYHGLVVASEFNLPELTPLNSLPYKQLDVRIKLGDVSLSMGFGTLNTKFYSVSENLALFDMPNIGRFQVESGKKITVSPYLNAKSQAVRHFLLGIVFITCLHQKKLLPLHASSIIVNGHGVAFAGESGMGKSTTAVSLAINKGYALLSDDTTVVRFQNQLPKISASFPKVKLWEDALDSIETLQNQSRTNLSGYGLNYLNKPKYGLILKDIFSDTLTTLKILYVLKKENAQKKVFRFSEKSKMNGISVIQKSISKKEILQGTNTLSPIFEQCIKLSKAIIIKEIYRPVDNKDISSFINFLEVDFKKICFES